ncbi:MAG: hypothetical protein V3R65_05660 [Acidiferrobacterales bacterium]
MQLSEDISFRPLTRELVSGLIMAYYPTPDSRTALSFTALCGIPVALLFNLLLRRG